MLLHAEFVTESFTAEAFISDPTADEKRRGCNSKPRRKCPEVSPAKRRLDFDAPSPSSSSSPTSTVPAFRNQSQSVRRNVFGCADVMSEGFVGDELGKVAREKATEWNFDFVKGIPLPGRFQWEPMIVSTDDDCCDIHDEDEMTEVRVDEEMAGFVVVLPGKREKMAHQRQLLITDVFRCRKRASLSSAAGVGPLAENTVKRQRLDNSKIAF